MMVNKPLLGPSRCSYVQDNKLKMCLLHFTLVKGLKRLTAHLKIVSQVNVGALWVERAGSTYVDMSFIEGL